MTIGDRFETAALRASLAWLRAPTRAGSLQRGAGLGDLARWLGLRRQVAESNLAAALPERGAAERATILREHYRELGRVAAEYARFAELVRAPGDEVVAEVTGIEHFDRAVADGRGAILLTGHFGNFELAGAWLGQRHPVSIVAQRMGNPGAESWIATERGNAGVGVIPLGAGIRALFTALRENRCVALLADQDARSRGVFVPFLGRPASTPVGPAALALRTGAPLLMGFDLRLPDGRHRIVIEPPLTIEEPNADDATLRLTAAHAERLEHWVRRFPERWFWLHRRWKTRPPANG